MPLKTELEEQPIDTSFIVFSDQKEEDNNNDDNDDEIKLEDE
jgi:hypothetical protein